MEMGEVAVTGHGGLLTREKGPEAEVKEDELNIMVILELVEVRA